MRRVQHGAFTSFVLGSNLDGLEPADRGFITDVVYGTLRHERFLDACLAPHLKRPGKLPGDVRNALRAASYELLVRQTARHAVVNEWVSTLKRKYGRLAGLVNAVLRKIETIEADPAVRYSVPGWLYADWQQLFGRKRAAEVAKAMLEPEPLWLTAYNPDAPHLLQNEACEVSTGPLPQTLSVKLSRPLAELSTYRRGLVQPQNPSSAFVARLLNAQKDESIYDLASGNGVKAAQLAATGARVTSIEADARKVASAKANLERLGLEVDHQVHDLTEPLDLEPAPKVLLDAPCSGTGTLRGHPEIKRRISEHDLIDLSTLQAKMLETAASLTAVDGVLVYAICALTSTESRRVIEGFLDTHPVFQLEPISSNLPQHTTPWGSYLLPLNGLDGFFLAALRRRQL